MKSLARALAAIAVFAFVAAIGIPILVVFSALVGLVIAAGLAIAVVS